MYAQNTFRVYTQSSEEIEATVRLTFDITERRSEEALVLRGNQAEINSMAYATGERIICYAEKQTRLWGLALPSPGFVLDRHSFASLEDFLMDIRGDGFRITETIVRDLKLTGPLPPPPVVKELPPAPKPKPSRRERFIDRNTDLASDLEEFSIFTTELRAKYGRLYEVAPDVAQMLERDLHQQMRRMVVGKEDE